MLLNHVYDLFKSGKARLDYSVSIYNYYLFLLVRLVDAKIFGRSCFSLSSHVNVFPYHCIDIFCCLFLIFEKRAVAGDELNAPFYVNI